MESSTPPPVPPVEPAPSMMLGARLMNVFSSPGEVFDEVKRGPPSTANWLAPALLLCLAGIISAFVIFSQDSILQQLKEQQEAAMERKLEKVPKEQREQVLEMMDKIFNPLTMKILGSGGAVVRAMAWLFLVAAVFWLVGTRALKGSFTYGQAVEVCGLTAMISVLGVVVSMLLAVVMGSALATPGPILLIREPSAANPLHLLLSMSNLTAFWYLGVLAVGLSRLTGASVVKAGGWLAAFWLLATLGYVAVSAGGQRL